MLGWIRFGNATTYFCCYGLYMYIPVWYIHMVIMVYLEIEEGIQGLGALRRSERRRKGQRRQHGLIHFDGKVNERDGLFKIGACPGR